MTTPDDRRAQAGIEQEQHHDTAEAFSQALSAANDLWNGDASKWIFRGQANAEWRLTPTALRGSEGFVKVGITGDPSDWSTRKRMIDKLLEAFHSGLERSAIVIPSIAPPVVYRNTSSVSSEPDRNAFPLMALAQHHGLPTLLLDWSRLARVAAYFATAPLFSPEFGALPEGDRGTHLAVWALRLPPNEHPYDDGWHRHLVRYEAPGSTNPNLHAQSGLFTLQRDVTLDFLDPAAARDRYVSVTIETFVARMQEKEPGKYLLRRMTLPHGEASRLLRLLSHEGVDGASMFPGPDGVVRAMRERALWDAPTRSVTP